MGDIVQGGKMKKLLCAGRIYKGRLVRFDLQRDRDALGSVVGGPVDLALPVTEEEYCPECGSNIENGVCVSPSKHNGGV